ncbi:hypothetical protein [Catellatospora sichuanensis]|uniref:FDXHR family putative zinc-binding protein n=1 Tax=Catellatospora sichuanensis TaxID=1969805 RepID=UPI003CCC4E06
MGTRCPPGGGCRTPRGQEAHCTVCHNSFSGVTYFDDHRQEGYCLSPVTRGLIRQDDLWASPEGHEQRRASAERMAKARAGRGKKDEDV